MVDELWMTTEAKNGADCLYGATDMYGRQ